MLDYEPPYEWDTLIAFLAARATPGVEIVESHRYRRAVSVGDASGTIDVRVVEGRSSLALDVRMDDAAAIPQVVHRVRRMFDLDLRPSLLADHFAGDPLLAPRLATRPGIRLPRAWDPFELAIRAVLGQQVSVRAATTLASRIATTYGTPLDRGDGLTRLVSASGASSRTRRSRRPASCRSRARTIRALAAAVDEGRIVLDPAGDGHAVAASLTALPGIGPWTASYIAMRGFGEADAFPSGDFASCSARPAAAPARVLEQRSQAWRPWRAYAVMLLWLAPVQ